MQREDEDAILLRLAREGYPPRDLERLVEEEIELMSPVMKRQFKRKYFLPPRSPEMTDVLKHLVYMAVILGGAYYLHTR